MSKGSRPESRLGREFAQPTEFDTTNLFMTLPGPIGSCKLWPNMGHTNVQKPKTSKKETPPKKLKSRRGSTRIQCVCVCAINAGAPPAKGHSIAHRHAGPQHAHGQCPCAVPMGHAPGQCPRGNAPGQCPRAMPRGNAPGQCPGAMPTGRAQGQCPWAMSMGDAWTCPNWKFPTWKYNFVPPSFGQKFSSEPRPRLMAYTHVLLRTT